MLKHEGPALFGVAFEAGLFIAQRLVNHARTRRHPPGGSECAVRIVAIGAGHETLVDAMLEGHVELRSDRLMARIAEVGLIVGEQEFRRRGMMDGVTARADDVVQRMRGPAYIASRQRLGMAAKAVVEDLARLKLGEGDDRALAAMRFDVRFTRAMTAFATSALGWLFARRDAFEVRVLIEARPDVRMTGAADITAYEAGWRACRGGLRRRFLSRCGTTREIKTEG